MAEAALQGTGIRRSIGVVALEAAARFWFFTSVAGQWLFAASVAVSYTGAALSHDAGRLAGVLPHGFEAGSAAGYAAIYAHLALALIVLLGGPLQFSQGLRARAPQLHRWNGRIYLPATVVTSLIGTYMVLHPGSIGDTWMHVGMVLNTVLVLWFAWMALRNARARDFTTHRRWAMRLFLVSNGVWFFRVFMFLWIAANGGPRGFDPGTLTGPAITAITFAQTLLPLAVLEIYLRVQRGSGEARRIALAAALAVLTIVMSFGIYMLANHRWVPRILGDA